jgi:hypothetical protein
VRADLRHQEHTIAPVRDRFAHDALGLAVMIFPCVVHERDTGVDRCMRDANGFALGARLGKVVSAQSKRGYKDSRRAERTIRNLHEAPL